MPLDNITNESESWPGPFATAHAIMAKRSEAKQAREEAIKAAKNKNELSNNSNFEGEDGDDDQRDIYEVAVGSLSWTPSTISDRQSVVLIQSYQAMQPLWYIISMYVCILYCMCVLSVFRVVCLH